MSQCRIFFCVSGLILLVCYDIKAVFDPMRMCGHRRGHLPVGVDTIHAHAVVTEALSHLPEKVSAANARGADVQVGDIRVLPTQVRIAS